MVHLPCSHRACNRNCWRDGSSSSHMGAASLPVINLSRCRRNLKRPQPLQPPMQGHCAASTPSSRRSLRGFDLAGQAKGRRLNRFLPFRPQRATPLNSDWSESFGSAQLLSPLTWISSHALVAGWPGLPEAGVPSAQ